MKRCSSISTSLLLRTLVLQREPTRRLSPDKPLPTLAHTGKDNKEFRTLYSLLKLIQPAYLSYFDDCKTTENSEWRIIK